MAVEYIAMISRVKPVAEEATTHEIICSVKLSAFLFSFVISTFLHSISRYTSCMHLQLHKLARLCRVENERFRILLYFIGLKIGMLFFFIRYEIQSVEL